MVNKHIWEPTEDSNVLVCRNCGINKYKSNHSKLPPCIEIAKHCHAEPKNNIYKVPMVRRDKPDEPYWVDVVGKPVHFKGFEDYQFFIYGGENGTPYRVCELSSKMFIKEHPMKLQAINMAKNKLVKVGHKNLEKYIQKCLSIISSIPERN